jgi:hypothetical protein
MIKIELTAANIDIIRRILLLYCSDSQTAEQALAAIIELSKEKK